MKERGEKKAKEVDWLAGSPHMKGPPALTQMICP